MTSRIARRAAVLVLSVGALLALPVGVAHADTYEYPCGGVVIQHGPNGERTAYWYDQNGNWGQLPEVSINWDLSCWNS